MMPEQIDKLMQVSAKNGQLVLLNDVLRWAKSHEQDISEDARAELIELAAKYS